MATAVYNRLHNSSLLGGSGAIGGSGIGGHHSQLARSLERILEEAHHSGELILTNRKLKDFPKTATKYNLTDTVIADLSRNRFCELPEDITTFSFLETLLLYHNTIRSIPESVKHLTSLTYLDLRSNQLSTLPREICFLPLQVLLVSNNRLMALPDELGRMDRLTDLDASYNQLSALPARIGELRSLRSFSLRSNQLMYLPRELTCLTLVSLDVSNNRIASLPLEIRQMSTLVEFNLENNPLTSPPASLCVRGLVHVFKFLETQATKDEKGSRAGGNYDGYTTLRRAPRHNSSSNVLESNRVPRHCVDSGYSTCDGIDKRWSHDMPNSMKPKNDSPVHKLPKSPPSSLSSTPMDASLTSSSSTIVDETISNGSPTTAAVIKPYADASPLKQKPSAHHQQIQMPPPPLPPTTLHQHINYAHSSSSNGSSPDQEDALMDSQQQVNHTHNKSDDKINKNLGNIQTYREYKEALKQQRNQEISSVYKIKGQKTLYDMSEATNALNSNAEHNAETRCNGTTTTTNSANTTSTSNAIILPKSIMKNGGSASSNGINGSIAGVGDDCLVIPKKPIQKVIPSRNTELMSSAQARLHATNGGGSALANGDCLGGYVKPNSPMKIANGGILTNNGTATVAGKFNSSTGMKSPVSTTTKLGGTTKNRVTWNHDIPAEKLSFTMRREFDRQREETELMTQLRSIIETRLKMTLPEDIASALTDGVILCHLANYVRPRSVASIHVPSPGVSKLTMARCRRNVDNFLEACRKIGVDEELICSCADVVPPYDSDNNDDCSNKFDEHNNDNNFGYNNNTEQEMITKVKRKCEKLPNPSAVLKTVSALIALDNNPHHQNMKNLQQQQQQLQRKLHLYQQYEKQGKQQQQHYQSHTHDTVEEQQQLNFEQQQQTATGTKQQQQQHHEIVANMEFNSTLDFNTAKCHFENTLTTNGNSSSSNNDADDVDDDGYDDVDNVVDAYNIVYNTQPQQQHQQQHTNTLGNFLRHAKLKTFQKIKLNLISTHGGGGSGSGTSTFSNSINHCSMLTAATTTTLQTIVETENDVGGGGITGATAYETGDETTAIVTDDSCGGAYQLINEKFKSNDSNKYKLLELPSLELKTTTATSLSNGDAAKMVSKRIEFFEHSANSPLPPTVPAKPTKTKNGIFSIYRIVTSDDGKLLPTMPQQQQLKDCSATAEVAGKEAGSSTLLKHDSHVLTMILSCVFMVTFLLLVFFPLPG